ncbi:MAG: hypothetical protein HY822_06355 [Acidobacteria bacterium]|nr:hypothetical protein [Acidobacteriota bacterium]
MNVIPFELGDGVTIHFEAEPSAVSGGPQPISRLGDAMESLGRSFEGSVEAIGRMAGVMIGKVRECAPDPPTDVEITFGLKASAELQGFVIAKAGAEANYTVRLAWKSQPAPR